MGRAGSPSDGRRVDVPVVSETARSSGLRLRARQWPRPGGGWQRRGRRRPVGWWERPLPAGRVSEDGKGVMSHEVPPASSSSEGRRPWAEGFVQSSRRPGKVRLRTVGCRGQSEQQVVSEAFAVRAGHAGWGLRRPLHSRPGPGAKPHTGTRRGLEGSTERPSPAQGHADGRAEDPAVLPVTRLTPARPVPPVRKWGDQRRPHRRPLAPQS